jgi:chromosome transmission fidelity protein 1
LAWLLNGEGDEENCEDATSKVLDEPEWIRQARGQIMKRPKLEPIEMRTRTSKFKRKKSNDLDDSIQKLLEIVADSDEDQFTTRPPRKVYYCSRTHSQLAQVMTELKKILTIGQIGNIRAVTLASRKSTCINGAIRKLASAESVNQQCQELLTEDACPYYNKDKSAAMDALNVAFEGHAVVDIEEAVSIGRQHEACSYYGSRRYAIGAEIVTVPYNMILSRVTRDALDIDLRDALIIFDEAHNLVDAINELESCIVTREEIELISVGLRVYLSKFERRLSPNHHVLLQQLQHLTFRVATFMDKEDDKADIWMVNSFLTECGIEHINLLKIVDYLRESNLSPKLAFYSIEDQVNESGDPQTLNRFAKVLMALAASDADGRLIKGPIKLEYVALNPATVMRELCESAHSIILAGGTMKPIDDVVLQLFNKTNIRSYSCGHLDSIKQNVLGLVIGSGPTGVPLRFTHATRQDEKLLADTQQTLANICNIVPDGVVCFFASYQALDHFIANWTTRPLVEAKKQVPKPNNLDSQLL